MAFTTSKSLLAKVKSCDEISWAEFYRTYKPLVILIGGDWGLNCDEKEELLQKVMSEMFNKKTLNSYDINQVPDDVVFKYDPTKGRFRHYFRGIVRNHAIKILKARAKVILESIDKEDSPVKSLPSDDEMEAAWNKEWNRHVLHMAMIELKERVQPETYVAFEMYALHERSVDEVSKFLNISVSSVYTSKSRCISTLREIIKDLEEK